MKKILSLILIGVLNVVLLFLFLKFITFSIPYGVLLVSMTLFISGMLMKKTNSMEWLKTLLICLPTLLFSVIMTLEANYLWFLLIYFPIISYMGVISYKSKKYITPTAIVLTLICSFYLTPNLLFKSLTIPTEKSSVELKFTDIIKNKEITNLDLNSKVVVLSFFNTWCAPCIKELPELEELKEKYKNKDVEIILVCAGAMDTKEKVTEFYNDRKLNFKLWYDNNSNFYKKHNLKSVPSTMIIDKNRKIIHVHSGYNVGINLVRQLSKIIDKKI